MAPELPATPVQSLPARTASTPASLSVPAVERLAVASPGVAAEVVGLPGEGTLARWRRLPRRRSSLARRFLLANLAILAVAGLVVGIWVGDQLGRGIIDRTASLTALDVERFVEPSTESLSTGARLTPAEIDRLDGLLVAGPLSERIVSLRVWGPDGTVVYSPDHALIGQRFPVTAGLAQALQGRLYAAMSDLSGTVDAAEHARWDRLLEVDMPIRERGGERIVAIAQFHQLPTGIDREVSEARLWSWVVVTAAIVLSALLLFGIVKQGSDTITRQEAALTVQVDELSELLRQNEALGERVRTAAERATTTNERALRRISSDLHDGPGQTLSLALMRLDGLRDRAVSGVPPRTEELAEIEGSLRDAMKDMRTIAAGLRMPELERLSVADAVTRAVEDHRRRTGTSVRLDLGTLPASAPLSVKITFYRALQELLSNASRHGAGAAVSVKVDAAGGVLRLEVRDMGPGFDPARLADSPGLGLAGMREQAELLGGDLSVLSLPGQGTTVRAWWPLQAPHPSAGTPMA